MLVTATEAAKLLQEMVDNEELVPAAVYARMEGTGYTTMAGVILAVDQGRIPGVRVGSTVFALADSVTEERADFVIRLVEAVNDGLADGALFTVPVFYERFATKRYTGIGGLRKAIERGIVTHYRMGKLVLIPAWATDELEVS